MPFSALTGLFGQPFPALPRRSHFEVLTSASILGSYPQATSPVNFSDAATHKAQALGQPKLSFPAPTLGGSQLWKSVDRQR